MRQSLTTFGQFLGSLRLTVWLLAFSVILVFFGTLDQVKIGIREAQLMYFESLIAFWHYPETWPLGRILNWIPLPVPGGYLLGPLLVVNLIAAHIRHFRMSWHIVGISLIHLGVVMLLVGQLITNIFQKEHFMWLDEGETSNYARSFHEDELVIQKRSEGGETNVYSVPYDRLKEEKTYSPEKFPFEIRVLELFPNAKLEPGIGHNYRVDRGIGAQFNLGVQEIPRFRKDDQRDVRTAVVKLEKEGETLGTWLVANVFEDRFPEQTFTVDGEKYEVALRFKRQYMPFSLTLLEFIHERYPGTNIPRNFASRVRLNHPAENQEKELMIFMNHPLRYEGLTFFQASFAKQDTASMFHVVRNPGWLVPYVACILVSVGLLYQFTLVSLKYLKKP